MSILGEKYKNLKHQEWTRLVFSKYTLSLVAFIIWVSFMDGHNLMAQKELKGTIEGLKLEKDEYVQLIADAKVERQDIELNKEKYAREKYFMHKENEKVFIILNDKKEK